MNDVFCDMDDKLTRTVNQNDEKFELLSPVTQTLDDKSSHCNL